jgi:cystathionine beta-lyase/cystathionine gamma-synthase
LIQILKIKIPPKSPSSNSQSSMIPLINLTSTYKRADAHNPKAYQYSRFGNLTRNALENSLAALDNAKYAVTFSSGKKILR